MFRSGNGLGAAASGCFAALVAEGFNPLAVDTSELLDQAVTPSSVNLSSLDLDRPGTLILYANPPELELCLFKLGFRRWHKWRIVGAWVWETPAAPLAWKRQAAFVSEVWVPSQYVASAFRSAFDAPIKVVPHYVRSPTREAASGNLTGSTLYSLSDRESRNGRKDSDTLQILTLADARSSLSRKNPIGAINMFRLAFPDSENVQLIVKTQHLSKFPGYAAQLTRAICEDPRIKIVDRTVSAGEYSDLLNKTDILLSPHRSEGFGLSLAEAMAAGKCVVATGWSGNMDFMSGENSVLIPYSLVPVRDPTGVYASDETIFWAEPDTAAGADALWRLARNPDIRAALGAKAQAMVHTRLGSARYSKAIFGKPEQT